MNNNGSLLLSKVFGELKKRGDKALITFLTAGDPDLSTTKELVFELERSGADIIELGVPFSDPMADGPTIQASSERALKKGATLADVLRLVRDIRKKASIPIVLFGYYNPVFVYGLKRFARDANKAGCNGVLIVDLPPEESQGLGRELKKKGIALIYLLTPTSDDGRMELVAKKANGFVYYVSVTGTTGARSRLEGGRISKALKRLRRFTTLPVGVGFGISTPSQAREASRWADGVIVGSAIVNKIEKNLGSRDLVKKVGRFVAALKRGMRP